jgi:beta-galactosidase
LEVDGRTTAEGELPPLNAPPRESRPLIVTVPVDEVRGERWLRVLFRKPEATAWSPAGWESAIAQFPLPPINRADPRSADAPPLELAETAESLQFTGPRFEAHFDRQAATLKSLRYDGRNVLTGPVEMQAYRAPTDNDRGFGFWLAKEWSEAGLDRLTIQPVSIDHQLIGEASASVTTIVEAAAEGGVIRLVTTWVVNGDGVVTARCRFLPSGSLPPLPRLGVVTALAPRWDQLDWFGRGPWESYPDRKAACDIGRYRGPVSQQATPFPRPQETGSHEETRWAAVTDRSGAGVVVVATDKPFAFSAIPYKAADLVGAKRWVDLKPRAETILSIDAAQCGLGNSSCGPGVLVRYAVLPVERELSFALAPLRPGEDAAVIARRARTNAALEGQAP